MTATVSAGGHSTSLRRRVNSGANPWTYVAPAVVVVGLLTIVPLIYGIYLSFTNWSLTTSATPRLQGIGAYTAVFDNPQLLGDLFRTILWTLGTVLIEVAVAIPLAMLLNVRSPVTGALTGLIMIPWITPFVVLSYAWLFLYSGDAGPLHTVLQAVGLVGEASPLATPSAALWAITIISGWKGIPFLAIAVLAARKSIPDELYEASTMDGAGRWRKFFSITLPLLRPVIVAMCVVLGVQAFYSFDLVWILTQGGPGYSSRIIGVELFQTFFTQASPGQAAALGTILLVLVALLAVPVVKASNQGVDS